MRCRALSIGLCAAFTLAGATACASANSGHSAASGHTVTAKLGILQPEGTATTNSAEQFAKLASKYSNGTVNIKVYANGTLGSTDTEAEALVNNTQQFFVTPDIDSIVPAVDALELPYLFPSAATAGEVLNGPGLNVLWNQFEAHNVKILGVYEVGYADILTTSKAISTPADLSGLRIRVFDPTVGIPVFSQVHADGLNLAAGQLVTALSTHAIDGLDSAPCTIQTSGWTSAAKHLAVTDHEWVSAPVAMSYQFWKGLSASQQQAVTKAFKQTLPSELQATQQCNTAAIAKMKASGVTVTYPNQASFKNAFSPVYAQLEKKYGPVIKALQTAISKGSE